MKWLAEHEGKQDLVIDKQGVIRYKQIGPITPEALQQKILPLAKKLAEES